MHAVDPSPSLYDPTPHGEHPASSDPAAVATPYDPRGHNEHDVDPFTAPYDPSAHCTH